MEHTHHFPTPNGVVLDDAVCSTCGIPVSEGAALFPSSTLDATLPEGEQDEPAEPEPRRRA